MGEKEIAREKHFGADFFQQLGWKPFPFQQRCWKAIEDGQSGLLNAPTGTGKTYAIFLGLLQRLGNLQELSDYSGLQLVWISPLRALSKDIANAIQEACDYASSGWEVGIRTGDTSAAERKRQKEKWPEVLVTTPESLHLLLASKNHQRMAKQLKMLVADEWHELLGTKRGVQLELAFMHLRKLNPNVLVWGMSATIGNIEQAMEVLLGPHFPSQQKTFIKAKVKKPFEMECLLPPNLLDLPWVGHLGAHLLPQVLPILDTSKSTLIFTNTRAQCEIWYQKLLEAKPELAGGLAMHHGSIDRELRDWVEEALHRGALKAVVCTSSLDLGVDFRPVESVIQIGGPKGVARFVQRAGRSGHRPGAQSKIYFLPTNALELVEASALRTAKELEKIEPRIPIHLSYDVLCQYLVTLAVGDGFEKEKIWQEVKQTYAFQFLQKEEFDWVLNFVVTGGESLDGYDDFQKVELKDGLFKVLNRKIAWRHRMHIGTIVSDPMLSVKMRGAGTLGYIEENFVSRLSPGTHFAFAGRILEFVQLKDLVVKVKPGRRKSGIVPQYAGGRMSFSSELSFLLRQKIQEAANGTWNGKEMNGIKPILKIQEQMSFLPKKAEFLIEHLHSEEGYHLFFYPFEGRQTHEVLAAIVAFRMNELEPRSCSLSYNDYGFEILSDTPFRFSTQQIKNFFTLDNIQNEMRHSINEAEMARRRFREIAVIAGLVFTGFPGKPKRKSHLQASSGLIFEVFRDYDPENLLLSQAAREVLDQLIDEERFISCLKRIQKDKLVLKEIKSPSPFAMPIMVDRFKAEMSSESLSERVAKMQMEIVG